MTVIIEQDIWTVISNLAFMFPAIYLLISNLYVEAFVYFNITIWSSLYHLCYSCGYCIIGKTNVLQFMDFFSAYLCVAIIIIYFIDIYPRKYKVILQCIGAIIVLFLANIDYFETANFVITLSLFIPFGMIHFGIYLLKWFRDNKYFKKLFKSCFCSNKFMTFIFNNRHAPFHPFDILSWLIGTVIFTVGFVLPSFVRNPYWVIHSIWHVTSGIGAMFIFTLYNKQNILTTLFKKIKKSFESKNIDTDTAVCDESHLYV